MGPVALASVWQVDTRISDPTHGALGGRRRDQAEEALKLRPRADKTCLPWPRAILSTEGRWAVVHAQRGVGR